MIGSRMTEIGGYLIFFLIVLGINLLPAFGPPTWTVIALYGLNSRLPIPAIVIVGAVAAALGRFLLALASRKFSKFLPQRWKRNFAVARAALELKRRHTIAAVGLFSLSPLPSAQLFEAAGFAGLSTVRLLGLTSAFFVGRTISYAFYALTAKGVSGSTLGREFEHSLTSPIGIAIQLLMIGLLILLAHFDWTKKLGGKPKRPR